MCYPIFLAVEGKHSLDYNLMECIVLGDDVVLTGNLLHFGEVYCLYLQGNFL
jgi:hypothetical protein